MEKRPKKLLDNVRKAVRLKHYSLHTEQSYVTWIKRYIFFHDKPHPKDMGGAEVEAFPTHLAVHQKVADSTQNQALSALLFLYRDVLRQSVDRPIDAIHARKPKRLPTVLTKEKALRVIGYVPGSYALRAKLLYGIGLRLMECLRLRVKDIDFAQHQIVVRDGKGMEDRITMLPASLVVPLQEHLAHVKHLMSKTQPMGTVQPIYRLHENEKTRVPAGSGCGNTCFPHSGCHETPARQPSTGTMPVRVVCNGLLARQVIRQSSPNASVVTPFGIALRRICSSRAMISGRCKNYWATRM
jgi:integrase